MEYAIGGVMGAVFGFVLALSFVRASVTSRPQPPQQPPPNGGPEDVLRPVARGRTMWDPPEQ